MENGIIMNLIVMVIGAGGNAAEQECSTACFGMLSSEYWTWRQAWVRAWETQERVRRSNWRWGVMERIIILASFYIP